MPQELRNFTLKICNFGFELWSVNFQLLHHVLPLLHSFKYDQIQNLNAAAHSFKESQSSRAWSPSSMLVQFFWPTVWSSILLLSTSLWLIGLKMNDVLISVLSDCLCTCSAYKKYSPPWTFYPFLLSLLINHDQLCFFNCKIKTI